MKLSNGQLLVLILAGILVASYLGYITIPGIPQQGVPSGGTPSGGTPSGGTPSGGTTHASAALQLQVVDAITSAGVTGATTSVDVAYASNGIFDLLAQSDTVTYDATPHAMNVFYPDGAELILHVDGTSDPTGGLDYYSGWYYVKLHDGNQIFKITAAQLSQVTGSPHFTYSVSTSGAQSTGSVVAFTSGTTNYWDIGKIFLYPRVNVSNLNLYAHYSGTTLVSCTNGVSAMPGTNGTTANATLNGDTEHISFDMTFDAANVGFGWNEEGVSSQGEFVTYKPVLVMSTNMTAIDSAQLSSEGWVPINDNTLYAEKAFYKVLSPSFTTKGSVCPQVSIQVPIYCAAAAASQTDIVKFWLLDMQLPSSVGIGSTTVTAPTAYGMMTAYGLSKGIQYLAYSSSSGAGSGQVLGCWVTTPA